MLSEVAEVLDVQRGERPVVGQAAIQVSFGVAGGRGVRPWAEISPQMRAIFSGVRKARDGLPTRWPARRVAGCPTGVALPSESALQG